MHRDNLRLQLANSKENANNRHLKMLTIESSIHLLLGKTQFTSDNTSKFGYRANVSNLRFLRSKTQLTSDITSKLRI